MDTEPDPITARPVAVTGATGFLGGHVVRGLLDLGLEVTALVRSGSDDSNLHGLPIRRVSGDLHDEGALDELVRDAGSVAHLAALVSFDPADRERIHRANVDGTRRVLEAAQRTSVRRFLHCSSTAAIGIERSGRPADEACIWDLDRFGVAYLDTKHEAERLALGARRDGFEVVVVNPAALFGPGDRRAIAYESVRRIRAKGLPICPPGGLCVADVRDVAAGLIAAWRDGADGERYILGGPNLTGRELAEALVRPFGHRMPRLSVPGALLRPTIGGLAAIASLLPFRVSWPLGVLRLAAERFWFDSGRAERVLGYTNTDFATTMQDAADWLSERFME